MIMRVFFNVLLLFLLALQTQAQFKNILLDPGDSRKPYDPSIAVNPDDPENIVAISALNNVYYSSNSGASWERSEIKSSFGIGGHPVLLADFKGNFYYFHLPGKDVAGNGKTVSQLIIQESGDKGRTWSDGSAVEAPDVTTKDRYSPRAVVDRKGNFYATWTQFDTYGSSDVGCQSTILLSSSSNGKKWSKPLQISQTPGDCLNKDLSAIGASPAVTADGSKIFVAWANQNKIYFDRSFGGKMWLSTDLAIVEQPGGAIFNVPGLDKCNGMPKLLCDNTKEGRLSGALYLVWSDQRNGESDTDIWFSKSLNFGDNWTMAIRINNDAKGKQQFLPAMALDPSTGYIYILYYDRRNYDDLQTDVYLAFSLDGGFTFKNVKISETPFTPSASEVFGDYISISANNGIVTPIWTRMDNGKTSIWTAVIKAEDLEKIKD